MPHSMGRRKEKSEKMKRRKGEDSQELFKYLIHSLYHVVLVNLKDNSSLMYWLSNASALYHLFDEKMKQVEQEVHGSEGGGVSASGGGAEGGITPRFDVTEIFDAEVDGIEDIKDEAKFMEYSGEGKEDVNLQKRIFTLSFRSCVHNRGIQEAATAARVEAVFAVIEADIQPAR